MVGSLFIGCSEEEEPEPVVLGSCVIRAWHELGYVSVSGATGYNRYKCYDGLYTKKECADKSLNDGNDTFTYLSYGDNETCSEFCARDSHDIYGNCSEY